MTGAVVIAVILVFVIPIGVALSGAAIAGVLGFSLVKEGEAVNEGSELIELNR